MKRAYWPGKPQCHGTIFWLCLLMIAHFAPAARAGGDEARIFNRQGVLLAQKGDINGAITAFQQAAEADSFDVNARSNLASAFNNLGVHVFQKGDLPKALSLFEKARAAKPEDVQVRLNLLAVLVSMRDIERVNREARSLLALRPNDADIMLKVANAFQRIEDSESAGNLLERVISAQPENDQALFSLGRLYYFQGNLSEARFYLERSVEASPLNASASAMLRRLSREDAVEEKLERENSVHFSLAFDEKISRDFAREILDLLEEAYHKIGDALGSYPSQRTQTLAYIPADFRTVNALPTWAGGSYDGKIRLPLPPGCRSAEQIRGAIFHEYTHHVVHSLTNGKCPLWLNEGLAQYFEGISLPTVHRLLGSRPQKLLEAARMNQSVSDRQDRDEVELFYAQALGMLHVIIEEKGLGVFPAMLGESCQARHFDDILLSHTNFTPDQLIARLAESLEIGL
jgi:tetratricopeptide (TPR) repeat protein